MALTVIIIEVLFLFLLFSTRTCSSGVAPVYYVKPTPDTKCPGNPCFTLSEYAQNASQYFTSNGTFDFLPGNHSLDRDITVFNVSSVSLSFIGQQSNASQVLSWITCTEPAFFNFTRVKEIKVDALGFSSCGRGNISDRPCALYFDFVLHFSIENSFFEHSLASSLLVSLSSGTMENVSFINNTASQYGGAVLIFNSSLIFLGATTFSGNKAGLHGGAMYAQYSSIEFRDVAVFKNNMATMTAFSLGGAIALAYTTLQFRASTTFLNNTAIQGGGIGAFLNSDIYSNESISFLGNSARAGGAIFITQNCTIELVGNSNFTGNVANITGSMFVAFDSQFILNGTNTFNNNHNKGFGGIFVNSSNLQIEGNTIFSYNSADQLGAAMFIFFANVTMSGRTLFVENTAGILGGALGISYGNLYCSGLTKFDGNVAPQGGAINMQSVGYLSFTGTTVFTSNTCTGAGGGAITAYIGHITFNGTTVFHSNQAPFGVGGALTAYLSTITIVGQSNFTANSASSGGAIYSYRGDISFNGMGELSNNICTSTGGAMYLRGGSTTSFNGSFYFRENRALEGGAISIEQDSILSFVSPVQLVFTDNQAMCGGAIIVLNKLILTGQSLLPVDICFFEVFGMYNDTADVHLTFTDNTAEAAGSVLYGGSLQACTILFANAPVQDEAAIDYFRKISSITSHVFTSEISSDPLRICFCQNNTYYDCENELTPFYRSPGQSFNFSVVAVDQTTNPVPASIRATFSVESTAELGTDERTQDLNRFCSSLQYKVFSSSVSENLILTAESQCNELGTALRSVLVMLLPCPNGFEPAGGKCICEQRLQQLIATCDVETYSIERVNTLFWVNASYSSNGSYEGLIIYPNCPFQYCQAGPVNFTLSDPNAQCAFNRSGFLCGGCDSGFSLTLGSSQCAQCSNRHLALLIVFAVLGVALVLVISLCRLTVGVGTVNGLIFYANIVGINQTIFFPTGDSNVLTVFIAWVNLDFGIKTCSLMD